MSGLLNIGYAIPLAAKAHASVPDPPSFVAVQQTLLNVVAWLAHSFRSVQIRPAEVPGLLSGVGTMNTVAVFAYSTVLNRVAVAKHRKSAFVAFAVAWFAVALIVLGYVLNSLMSWNTGGLIDLGLLVWLGSFASVLGFVYWGTRDVVGKGSKSFERFLPFEDRSATAAFGVPFIDQVVRHAACDRGHVNYPILVSRDIASPGAQLATAYVAEGIRNSEG